MQNIDTVLMSLQAIRTNKLRSSLTLVGIILGVASIIAVGHSGFISIEIRPATVV